MVSRTSFITHRLMIIRFNVNDTRTRRNKHSNEVSWISRELTGEVSQFKTEEPARRACSTGACERGKQISRPVDALDSDTRRKRAAWLTQADLVVVCGDGRTQ